MVTKAYTLTPKNVIGHCLLMETVPHGRVVRGSPTRGWSRAASRPARRMIMCMDYNAAGQNVGCQLLFQRLKQLSPDSILGLMAKFRADPSSSKVDLGVGVYRDLSGNTPILASVRRAEQAVLAAQATKSYVAAAGREEFNGAVEEMVWGPAHATRRDRRARTTQTPGGCGALRVGAELIRAAAPAATVHVSDPTWGNHAPLLGGCGLKLERYPYYD